LFVNGGISSVVPMRPARGARSAARIAGSIRRAVACAGFVLLLTVVAPAVASATAETLAGGGATGYSPDNESRQFSVDATSVDGVASGTLSTNGKVSGDVDATWAHFEGSVTCMAIEGDRAVVGAVGAVSLIDSGPGSTPLPGTYGQLLNVELGEFRDPNLEEPTSYSFRYEMLGEHGEGVEAMTDPDCAAAAPLSWLLPSWYGSLELTPTALPTGEAIVKLSEETPSVSEETPSAGGGSSSAGATSSPLTLSAATPAPAPDAGIAGFTKRRLIARITSVKVSRRRVRVVFASAGGSGTVTFVCRVDGKPAHRCASPMRLRLTPGRHRFSIAAVTSGEQRSAPASASISVG
jgi:hypothetical protein